MDNLRASSHQYPLVLPLCTDFPPLIELQLLIIANKLSDSQQ